MFLSSLSTQRCSFKETESVIGTTTPTVQKRVQCGRNPGDPRASFFHRVARIARWHALLPVLRSMFFEEQTSCHFAVVSPMRRLTEKEIDQTHLFDSATEESIGSGFQ